MTHVLIVEDSRTQAERLRLILEAAGYSVESASSAEDGLARIAASAAVPLPAETAPLTDATHSEGPQHQRPAIDLIVSDVMMPGMSGYDFCRKIKHDPRTRRIPVVLLTMLSDPLDIIHGLECGADNFITKPYEPPDLVARIETLLTNRRLRAATGKLRLGVEVMFLGRTVTITSEKEQILDLLVATFEDIVRANQNLVESQAALSQANAQIEDYARRLESQVRVTEGKYATLMAHATDAIVIASADGQFLEANRRAEALFGVSAEQLAGRRITDFVAGDESAENAELLRRFDSAESIAADGVALRRADGGETVFVDISAPVIEHAGEQVRFAILRDVTEKKRTADELRELAAVLSNAVEGIVKLDAQGRFISVNHAFLEMTGYAEPELLGMHWQNIVDPSDHDLVADQLRRVKIARRAEVEVRSICKDGKSFFMRLTFSYATPTLGHTPAENLYVFAKDISAYRSLEEQFRHAQKMEAVGQLAGGIAHDFNNLLTVINGYADLMCIAPDSTPDTQKFAQKIRESGMSAANLTKQLLAFSRRDFVSPRILDLNAVVDATATMLRRLLPSRIELAVRLAPNLGLVRADPGQIEQVVMNLAINARDAMPNGGELSIETTTVTLDEIDVKDRIGVAPGHYTVLCVSDTGSGIDAVALPRIFEPFFTTKERGRGTGLGLATVYGIVKESQGDIRVYSEIGHGSVFRVYWPQIDEADETVIPSPQSETSHTGNETILVVEDEPGVRELARLVLAKHGYHVLTATDGLDALRIGSEHDGPIHLMLTDVMMPNLSGQQLAEKMRESRPAMKVVFASGYTDGTLNRYGIPIPGVEFLQKPFTSSDLTKKVRTILDHPHHHSD